MKVILKDNIKGVGKKDEIINASDGYARNFLFPKNLAVEANSENMSKLQAQKESTQYKKDVEKIRNKYIKGSRTHGLSALSKEFGVCVSQIGNIVRRESWKG